MLDDSLTSASLENVFDERIVRMNISEVSSIGRRTVVQWCWNRDSSLRYIYCGMMQELALVRRDFAGANETHQEILLTNLYYTGLFRMPRESMIIANISVSIVWSILTFGLPLISDRLLSVSGQLRYRIKDGPERFVARIVLLPRSICNTDFCTP
jgi:hypothetical protein